MNEDWHNFLTGQNMVVDINSVTSVGGNHSEIYSIDNTYLCDLSPLGIIRVSGEDAQNFLHSQFTNDLNNVSSSVSQLSSYCNPKGRMLSIFRIYMHDNGYRLILPRDVIEATLKKLNMFKLMAKVELMDESDECVIFGVAGPNTESILNRLNISLPQADHHYIQQDGLTAIRVPSKNSRALLIANAEVAIAFWQEASTELDLANSNIWELHDIFSGIPQVTQHTSETFIPQMTNLELIDGVSFSKGCYPGQEVVARTHYLGKPNRRMYRMNIADENVPDPGMNIYSPEDENQPVGKVVIAQKISATNSSALVVLRTNKANDENLHLGSVTGPKVSVQSLPYTLESNSEQT